jgi:hypothetical protein
MREQRPVEKLIVDTDAGLEAQNINTPEGPPPGGPDLFWNSRVDRGHPFRMTLQLEKPAEPECCGETVQHSPTAIGLDAPSRRFTVQDVRREQVSDDRRVGRVELAFGNELRNVRRMRI